MISGILQWWYTGGWRIFVVGLGERLRNTADFFSISILIKTLFAPFRQISANDGGASRMQAFLDKLFSRMVGMVVRVFIIVAGVVALTFQAIFGVILAILWPLIPFLPLTCIVLCIIGVTL